MELDLIINLENNKIDEIKELTEKLNKVLQEDKILVYQGYDSRKFTNTNEERIWHRREELIEKHINQNNINSADENKLYEIIYETSNGFNVMAYEETYANRSSLTVNNSKLPESVKVGMFFRKVDGNYVLDKETTEKVYNEMTSFQNELIAEQNKILNDQRQEGAIYKVTYLEDDCEDWRTELTNLKTGETFQELEFPHDIYHQVGVDSLVKYENGTYIIVEGTSIYDLYPNITENYCEDKGVYITQKGKYETLDELYKSLSPKKKESFTRRATNEIKKIVKFAVDKLVELVSKLKKFKQ